MARDPEAALLRRLVSELRADWRAVEARTADVRAFATPSSPPPAERTAALALALDRAYTALESILERVARTLEGGAPTGADWHRELLRNAALVIEKVRPAILGPAALAAADELRRFRHFLRHAYAAALDPARVATRGDQWLGAFAELQTDIDRFCAFVESLAERLEA
jgi:hypothetical protein